MADSSNDNNISTGEDKDPTTDTDIRTTMGDEATEAASYSETPVADTAPIAESKTVNTAPVPRRKSGGISGKVIAAIAIIAALAGMLLFAQQRGSSAKAVKLDAHQMEVLISGVMSPAQAQQLAADPEQKKLLVKQLKEMLAVAELAEKEGYANKPEVQALIRLQTALPLREAYLKSHPDAKVTDEEINAYHLANPNDMNAVLDSNPQLKAQAQGPQAESLKKEFAQVHVYADRARKENLGTDEVTNLKSILGRSQVLFQAYMRDKEKSGDMVSDAEIESYYKEHQAEFEEAQIRHILIGTEGPEHSEDDGHGHTKEEVAKQPKGLSKEEARKKAQSILDRIRAGEDFAKLAGENSDDTESKKMGGLLAKDDSGSEDSKYVQKGSGLVPEFENAAFALKPGEISGLVETDFGFHIIKVDNKRTAPLSSEEVREQIIAKIKPERMKKFLEETASKSSVVVAEDFNIPAPPQAPAGLPQGLPAPPPRQ